MISDRPYRKALPAGGRAGGDRGQDGSSSAPRVVAATDRAIETKPGFWTGLGANADPSKAETAVETLVGRPRGKETVPG